MENSKLDFYKQIEMLGMDELIHPILLFHDQGTVKLQVWTDGALAGRGGGAGYGAKLGWSSGFQQTVLEDVSTEQGNSTLDLPSNREVIFLQVLVIARQASSPKNAVREELRRAGVR